MSESSQRSNDLSARDLVWLLWDRKGFVMAVTVLLTFVAGVIAWWLPREYEATVVVSPVSEEPGAGRFGGASALLSQVGGLASLAGFASPASSMREESIATLQSASLTQSFIDANHLVPILYAKQWDAGRKTWKKGKGPSLWKATDYFRKKVRTVVENKKSGLLNVSVTWTDPRLAAEWANLLVKTTNDYLRAKAIKESERNVAYLNEQIQKTNIVEVQKAVYSLMEAEIRKTMLARGTDEYALKVIDRALVPERASAPRVVLLLSAGFFAGLLLATVIVLTRQTLNRAV